MSIKDCYQVFSEELLAKGLLSDMDIAKVERLAKTSSALSLPQLLLDLGMMSEADLAEQLAVVSDRPRVYAKDLPERAVLSGVSPRFLKEFSIAGLYVDDERVGIALMDPLDDYVAGALSLLLNKQIEVHVGVRSEIEKVVGQQLTDGGEVETAVVNGNDDADIERLRDIASEAPVIRFVNALFQQAVDAGASDIHIESIDKSLKLRLRVDGVLKDVDLPMGGTAVGIISRVKLLAKLNIAERRLPQDGRIRYQLNAKEFDMRVSTSPTIHGEGVVIRLLDRSQIDLDFASLGFDGEPLERFLDVLAQPNGIILITGPTGSGKTTTLYTALTRLNTSESKIITVEDPVEYELEGINQIQVKADIDLTFSNILRSIVRQDPDIIMVGEMRDTETANIAVQSALTGHLVLTTLHTNDAASGMIRLLDMGVDDFLLASTVTGILAQRLMRRLCDHCKQAYEPPQELIEELALQALIEREGGGFYAAKGCEYCGDTGYKGRVAMLEFLSVSETIKKQVMAKSGAVEINKSALAEGMASMLSDGLQKAARGLTTLEEVVRLTKK
ncbi:MAG: GspE/PulE family protein [Cycloclasticus sp.]